MPLPTVNDDILNQQIKLAVFNENYAGWVTKNIRGRLKSSEKDLSDELNKRLATISKTGIDAGPGTTKRMKVMLKRLKAIRTEAFDDVKDMLFSEMQDFSVAQGDIQMNMMKGAIPPIGIDFVSPSPAMLKSLASNRPMDGALLKSWVSELKKTDIRKINVAIKNGIVLGRTNPQIINRVMHAAGISASHAETITRTAVNHFSNQARLEAVNSNDDLMKGLKIVATLDSRTSPICRHRDGKVYPIDTKDLPPYHPRCRTTFTYVLKSWKEMGIDIDEAPRGTRASMNGQVPADMSYNDWLKTQPKAVVEQVLGKAKAKLFANGGLGVTKFATLQGKPFTLNQLKSKYPDIWKSAGLPGVKSIPKVKSKQIPKPKKIVSDSEKKTKQTAITTDFAQIVANGNNLKLTNAAKDEIAKNPFLKSADIVTILKNNQPKPPAPKKNFADEHVAMQIKSAKNFLSSYAKTKGIELTKAHADAIKDKPNMTDAELKALVDPVEVPKTAALQEVDLGDKPRPQALDWSAQKQWDITGKALGDSHDSYLADLITREDSPGAAVLRKKLRTEYGLTEAESITMWQYTGGQYRGINTYLRKAAAGETWKDAELTSSFNAVTEVLSAALYKLPKFKGTAIRRANLPADVLEAHQVGETVKYDAFSSSTYSSRDKFKDNPHRLVIESKNGRKVDWHSRYDNEQEVLFDKNTRFMVKSREMKTDQSLGGSFIEIRLMEI